MSNVQLRILEEQDLAHILKWRNSERIKQYMYSDKEISWEEHLQWYQQMKVDPSKKVFIFLTDDLPLGLVQFYDINDQHNRCYWGFYIGEETAPAGSGTKMATLAINHMIDLGIRKICAEVITTNRPSLNFHQKLGFQIEGRFKRHIRKDKKYYDVISLALFQDEWKVRKERFHEGNYNRT
ncbi:UDP-4-amino-4,6-dideoxy-N-acetyl-beta-L-altrosamine N-acetyltransferase [Gracilibacillus kekensis]|uniref:UDP-4-amino-4,6-dideoxy-N-acetyl-beta-L-altrosamine N-acetyltransferase n=1 Tax=Gracilibacillus kekensis TaxID=1027249 RepID=A0A1M7NTN6_9BACI|nr:UDP-4-amino-4,6-dideoxy-N-acetyl-beta-L-altrosamine N-acetyltransferase [Gracilibacillus kekensis]SHN07394.1 UDP-4-amino-4,6-dideoxy-N-acetyl-beta-L-altrosamine N-acetyltransferase [Gracilibacillus kekensis]